MLIPRAADIHVVVAVSAAAGFESRSVPITDVCVRPLGIIAEGRALLQAFITFEERRKRPTIRVIGIARGIASTEPTLIVAPTDTNGRRPIAAIGVSIHVTCQADLPQIILAAHRARRFASLLDGWQKQADEYADDRDHY